MKWIGDDIDGNVGPIGGTGPAGAAGPTGPTGPAGPFANIDGAAANKVVIATAEEGVVNASSNLLFYESSNKLTNGSSIWTDTGLEWTPTTGDTFKITTATHGATTLQTTDTASALADILISADGSLRLSAVQGSPDQGANVGILLGCAGMTNQTADISVHHNGGYFTMYEQGGASTSDYFSIRVAEHGATTLTTLDAAAAAANLDFNIDGTFSVVSTSFNVDTAGQISGASWRGTAISSAYINPSQTGITSIGALAVGSIASGFGTISTENTITTTSAITGGSINATGATSAGDNAAMGYSASKGLVLTGQGSSNDVTIKNDTGADVISIPTGTTNVDMAGTLTLGPDDDTAETIKRTQHSDDNGGDLYVRAGDSTGTNKVGGTLQLFGGRATGTGAGGAVTIQAGSTSTSSGTTLRSCNPVASFRSDLTTLLMGNLIFEGASPDAHETTFSITDPTADRTITVPDASGTMAFLDSTLTTAAQTNITSVGTLTGLAVTGDITVGVDDTGHDVKFYGATAGSYLLWDQVNDRLKLRDSVKAVFGTNNDLEIYHDGTDNHIDVTSTLQLASGTSGVAINIGHATSETTIGDNLTVTGEATIPSRKFTVTSSTHFEYQGDVVYFGGSTTAPGDLCYLKENGTWGQADADGAATGDDADRDATGMLAIALGTDPDVDGMFIRGIITMDYDLGDVGNPVYISTTQGEMSSTIPTASGDFVRVVGYCLDDTHGQMYFNPDNTWVELS